MSTHSGQEVFFPEDDSRRHRRRKEERAKRICRDCPVISECREHALRTPETYGIWAAMTPRERAAYPINGRPNGNERPPVSSQSEPA
jgi:WhiB family redox-sensing transcriptional regulator